ncbi:GNAT family N-acetyltransferase [Macrococcus bovicus]|uniref:GNAT family N-acetyltransferase n=1 Tax=Macrococcus bovicus TaxID=69968 RepID=UPI0025A63B41|nr:GNAT family protein [Macrococcus bovicus]WJP97840.1 GNAT family protein [Macrococcus bovicus]
MLIHTERLVLKTPSHTDIKAFMEIRNSEGYLCFNPMPKVDEETDLHELKEQITDGSLTDIFYSDELIGMISLHPDNLRYRINSMNISYALHPEHEGKGYMTEALCSMIDYLFNHMQCEIIVARVFVCNSKSKRLIEQLGFQQEGFIHRAVRGNGDVVHDDYIFALMK